MKKFFVNDIIKFIDKHGNYSKEQIEIIKYGLEGLYLTISKIIFIFLIAHLLNISKEVLIFLIIYNVIRTTSFGLHATKSWICLITSTAIFIGIPILCMYIKLNIYFKLILGIILIIFIYKNSPADTKKRPIVNPKRRLFFKISSTIIAIIFVVLSIIIKNNFYSNCFIFSLFIQIFMISPTVYKIFNLPYNNYLNYSSN